MGFILEFLILYVWVWVEVFCIFNEILGDVDVDVIVIGVKLVFIFWELLVYCIEYILEGLKVSVRWIILKVMLVVYNRC